MNGKELEWGYLGNLTKIGDTTYSYDTSGRRLRKTTNGVTTNYYYAGDLLVGEKTGNNKIEYLFDINGDYYGFEYNDKPYYYFKNLQGDVVAVGEDYNTIVATYEYDAWCRLISSTDTSGVNIGAINPIRYRGYYYDTETGFYFLQTRYYSPEICRFLSMDIFVSTGQGVIGNNMFAYCGNNPVVNIDITGTMHVKGIDGCGGYGTSKSCNLGLAIYQTCDKVFSKEDFLFLKLENGISNTLSYTYNKDADFFAYFEIPDRLWNISDFRTGIGYFSGNAGFFYDANVNNLSIAGTFYGVAMECEFSPTEITFMYSYGVDYQNLSAESYTSITLRKIPTVALVAVCCLVPKAIPVVATWAMDILSQIPIYSPFPA